MFALPVFNWSASIPKPAGQCTVVPKQSRTLRDIDVTKASNNISTQLSAEFRFDKEENNVCAQIIRENKI